VAAALPLHAPPVRLAPRPAPAAAPGAAPAGLRSTRAPPALLQLALKPPPRDHLLAPRSARASALRPASAPDRAAARSTSAARARTRRLPPRSSGSRRQSRAPSTEPPPRTLGPRVRARPRLEPCAPGPTSAPTWRLVLPLRRSPAAGSAQLWRLIWIEGGEIDALPGRGGRGQMQKEQRNSGDKDGAARIRESRGERQMDLSQGLVRKFRKL
jgi:hypothetical protein